MTPTNTAVAQEPTASHLSLVARTPAADAAFATEVVARFLHELRTLMAQLDPTLPVEVRGNIFRKLNHFLCSEVKDFAGSFHGTSAVGAKLLNASPKNSLRYFCKQVVPYDMQQACRNNRVILDLYKVIFTPQDSKAVQGLQRFGSRLAMFVPPLIVTGLRKLVRTLLQSTYAVERLGQMDEAALRAMAARIVAADERFAKTYADSAEFNAVANPKKALFISAIFPTTWAPTVRMLGEQGWHTAWLGTRDIADFKGYGAVGTKEVVAHAAYPENFLGTVVFMAAAAPEARVLLNGESYYGANWNGEDAVILYLLTNAVTNTVRAMRTAGSNNLFLLMYDGLKPVARSRELKQEISKFYGGLMRSADKIIYNSNSEVFGQYVDNTYGVTCPRLHFYRYSERPQNPLPRLGYGENGDEFHMVCITVTLGEFEEPSRAQGPGFVRSIIEQGVHFHYYCIEDDPAVKAFRKSLAPEFQRFFHTHPLQKDQQALVNELSQFHVALNPSDHLPFAQGIMQVNDRDYQDGMAAFWLSTVGTSLLVYTSAGLPSVMPRGWAINEFMGEMAMPTYLSELKNIKQHLIRMGLRDNGERAARSSRLGWMETHLPRLVAFLEQA